MKLRITPDGTVRGLWDDAIDWPTLGRISVERASHVEFCNRTQLWHVRSGRPRSALRRLLQWALRRPFGEILQWAETRSKALAWEQEHFGPGGAGWSTGRVLVGRGLIGNVLRRARLPRTRTRTKASSRNGV